MHIERLTEEIKVYLNSSCNLSHCVQLFEYETVRVHLEKYLTELSVRVWVGTKYTNQALYELITPEVRPGSSHNLGRSLLKSELESERTLLAK